jgi:hypothetical protein
MNEQNQNMVSFIAEKFRRNNGASADEMAATMYAYLANERNQRSQQLAENSGGGEVICIQSMRAL